MEESISNEKSGLSEENKQQSEPAQAIQHSSTGPKTVAGKRRSAQNARKFGFYARECCDYYLVDEKDRREFSRLHRSLLEEYSPEGPVETLLVERISIHTYQYKLLLRVMATHRSSNQKEMDSGNFDLTDYPPPLDKWRHSLPLASDLDKLQRYEAHVLRNLYRATAELERVQALRKGGKFNSSVTIDL